jgi:DUF4097 and DUF4098 domain-containing protein YvlB
MKRPVVIILLVIALALVCVGIGSVIYFANGFQTNNPFDKRNIPSVLKESKTIKVDEKKPLNLIVVNDAGGVTVTGADVDTVQVNAVKTAYDSSQSRADQEVKGIKYTIEQTGDTLTLKYELPKSMNFSNNVNTVDFVVTVPNETTVNVENSMGEVNVASTKGNVDVKNNFGDVTIENIEGALSVQNNSGKVEATGIQAGNADINLHSDFGGVDLTHASGANITLDSNSGTISLSEVNATGKLITKAEFGDTKYENGSANSLNVETNSGKVTLTNLKVVKELIINNDFGEIELKQASAGSYDLHTNSGAINVDGANNKLKAYTEFGDITVENAQSVKLDLKTNSGKVQFSGSLGEGPHFIKSEFGEVSIALPSDSKLNVDLKTDLGGISSDIPLTVTLDGSTDKNHQVGTMNGGGDQLTVTTNSGSISIKALGK